MKAYKKNEKRSFIPPKRLAVSQYVNLSARTLMKCEYLITQDNLTLEWRRLHIHKKQQDEESRRVYKWDTGTKSMVDMTLENQEPRIYQLDLGYLIFPKSPSCSKIVKGVKKTFSHSNLILWWVPSHITAYNIYT